MSTKQETLDFISKLLKYNCWSMLTEMCVNDFQKRDYSSDKEYSPQLHHKESNHSHTTETSSNSSTSIIKPNIIKTRKLSTIKSAKKEHFLSRLPPEHDVQWKFESRCHTLQQLIHYVRGTDKESFAMVFKIVGELEKDTLANDVEVHKFHIDDKARKIVKKIGRLIRSERGPPLQCYITVEVLCLSLIDHLSPPAVYQKFPPEGAKHIKYLDLTNLNLFNNNEKFFRLLVLLKHNKRCEVLNLAFTGLSSVRVNQLLPYLAGMRRLSFLNLQGNRLNTSTVDLLDKLMRKRRRFRRLYWVDMRNNLDIIYFPDSLLMSFRKRAPLHAMPIDMRSLAEGKARY